jgi:toxin-antitoxin system PIN domain toxin
VSAAIDVNPLVYASDTSSPFHDAARAFVEGVAARRELVCVFWPTAMPYLRIVTHPSIFARPLSSREALANLESLLRLPHVRSPGEDAGFWATFGGVANEIQPRGNLVPGAHLVALVRAYGVDRIWTADLVYLEFRDVRVLDPFAAPA